MNRHFNKRCLPVKMRTGKDSRFSSDKIFVGSRRIGSKHPKSRKKHGYNPRKMNPSGHGSGGHRQGHGLGNSGVNSGQQGSTGWSEQGDVKNTTIIIPTTNSAPIGAPSAVHLPFFGFPTVAPPLPAPAPLHFDFDPKRMSFPPFKSSSTSKRHHKRHSCNSTCTQKGLQNSSTSSPISDRLNLASKGDNFLQATTSATHGSLLGNKTSTNSGDHLARIRKAFAVVKVAMNDLENELTLAEAEGSRK